MFLSYYKSPFSEEMARFLYFSSIIRTQDDGVSLSSSRVLYERFFNPLTHETSAIPHRLHFWGIVNFPNTCFLVTHLVYTSLRLKTTTIPSLFIFILTWTIRHFLSDSNTGVGFKTSLLSSALKHYFGDKNFTV